MKKEEIVKLLDVDAGPVELEDGNILFVVRESQILSGSPGSGKSFPQSKLTGFQVGDKFLAKQPQEAEWGKAVYVLGKIDDADIKLPKTFQYPWTKFCRSVIATKYEAR